MRAFAPEPYLDSLGVWTIGFGTNIGEGITRREAEFLLRERLAGTYQTLTADLPWLSDAPERQQSAILDLGYQTRAARSAWSSTTCWPLSKSDDCPDGQGCRVGFGVGARDAGARQARDRDSLRELNERMMTAPKAYHALPRSLL